MGRQGLCILCPLTFPTAEVTHSGSHTQGWVAPACELQRHASSAVSAPGILKVVLVSLEALESILDRRVLSLLKVTKCRCL